MNCKNCNTALENTDHYCKNCGGKVIRNRLTLKNLLSHFTETFLNLDNKLLKTVLDLIIKPEIVIGSYINGTRKRYINPISFTALTLTISGIYLVIITKYFPNVLSGMSPIGSNVQQEYMTTYWEFIQKYYTLLMVSLIPFYALISRLVFLNRKDFNFTEHIVMATYIMAQFSLVSSFLNILLLVLNIPSVWLSSMSIFLQIAYFAYCYKRLFKISFWGIILRSLWFIAILLVIFTLLIIVGIIFVILLKDSEMIQGLIETQKKSIELQKTVKDSIN